MKTLALILAIQLVHGGPVLRFPVDSCEAGRQWLYVAWDWASRCKIPAVNGPRFACYWSDKT